MFLQIFFFVTLGHYVHLALRDGLAQSRQRALWMHCCGLPLICREGQRGVG